MIDIRKSSGLIRDASKAVESHLVPGLKLQALMDAQLDPDVTEKIRKLEADILSASATAVMAKSIPFGTIQIPAKPAGITECLAETIDSVSASADTMLRAHVSRHHMGSAGQAWLAQGM